jgi:hypothetical protein
VAERRRGRGVEWFNVLDEEAGGEPGLINPVVLHVYDLEVRPDVVLTSRAST